MAESPYEAPDTPRLSLHTFASLNGDDGSGNEDRADRPSDPASVYVFSPSQTETAAYLKQGEGFMPRGGSEQPRPGSSRRQPSQQRRYPAPNPPPPPESPQNYNAPVYVTPQYAPAYGGQYMMSHQPPINMAHPLPYPAQSIHAGYPTIVSYPQQYPPDAQSYASQNPQPPPTAYRYPQSMSPSYSGYQQPTSFASQPAMYPPHGVYQQTTPYGSYPSPQHASPSPTQEGENHSGTWWFVPSPPPQQQQQQQQTAPYDMGAGQQQNPNPAPYFYGGPPPPAQHPDSPPHQQHYLGSPTYARASTPSSSASSPPPALPKPLVRRPYHPNPPAHRSEWVMWAGNVPSDAGHDELWRFFTAPSTASSAASSATSDAASTSASSEREPNEAPGTEVSSPSGVLSIFLISRSSCAFINYDTESALEAAIARFNGLPLRPADPRCARLVCRVRRRDDDLRAGVGGQRGMGMHAKYVRDKAAAAEKAGKGKARGQWGRSGSGTATDDESSESAVSHLSALSFNSGDEEPTRPPLRPHTHGSASSGGGSHVSGASTNSSLLTRHFPQRFFILKSLTRDDLDLSVRTGVWATQRHNEGVLDQAFRTAKDVFLIFSVNKSGEFYGYARMSGPVGQEGSGSAGSRVTWAARSPPLSSPTSPSGGRERGPPPATSSHPIPHGDSSSVHQVPQPLLSAGAHLVDESPEPLSATAPAAPGSTARHANSAPAVLGRPLRAFSGVDAGPSYSLDGYNRPPPEPQIELDEKAPFRAMRNVPEAMEELGRVPEEGQGQEGGAAEGWGQNFALHWLCTERLPFTRTRHIRNPWNHDREVKVSRDGTELEPGVGQALLEEWRAYLREQQGEATTTTTTTRS